MVNLRSLFMSGNLITGQLPSEMGLLPLVSVSLNLTAIEGTIPTEFGRLTDLTHLYLSSTDLTGTIPSELCALGITHLSVDCHEVICPPGCVCDCS